MNGQFLTLSSTILFYLLALLASIIVVDAGRCSTATTTTTVTTTTSSCTATPTPVLSCPDCRDPHQNCGDGNGHQDGKHCTVHVTCTLTETECDNPCCSAPGAPGWSNEQVYGGYGNFADGITSQECCNACITDTQCVAWLYTSYSCLHAGLDSLNGCSNLSPSQYVAAGIIRCSDGCMT